MDILNTEQRNVTQENKESGAQQKQNKVFPSRRRNDWWRSDISERGGYAEW